MKTHIFVLVVVCSLLPLYLSACKDERDQYIDKVKNSTMWGHDQTTIGKAFEATFDNPKWESGVTKKGRKVVQFTGTISEGLSAKLKKRHDPSYFSPKGGWNPGTPVTFQWVITVHGDVELVYIDWEPWGNVRRPWRDPKKWLMDVIYSENWGQTSNEGRAAAYPPTKRTTWLKCLNPACGAAYEMNLKAYFKYVEENIDPRTLTVLPMNCKKCGEPSVYRAEKCGGCGLVFERGSIPRDFADRCPKCGYSQTEEKRKNVVGR